MANHESAGMLCVEVKLLAFTKGKKKQLSQAEVGSKRQLSRVHIHVERVNSEVQYLRVIGSLSYLHNQVRTAKDWQAATPLELTLD